MSGTFLCCVSGYVVGIRPQGDKLYFVSQATSPEEMTISVLSLVNFTLLKELVVPAGPLYLFEAKP